MGNQMMCEKAPEIFRLDELETKQKAARQKTPLRRRQKGIFIDCCIAPGTDVIYFLNFAKILASLTYKTAKLCKKLIITLGFNKNANFSTENLQKSQ
jgi:hypothetical protein